MHYSIVFQVYCRFIRQSQNQTKSLLVTGSRRVHSLNENAEKVEKQVDTCNIVLSVLRVVSPRDKIAGYPSTSLTTTAPILTGLTAVRASRGQEILDIPC